MVEKQEKRDAGIVPVSLKAYTEFTAMTAEQLVCEADEEVKLSLVNVGDRKDE